MKNNTKFCTIPTPVHIGDAMFLGDLKSGAADERKAELSR